MRRFIAAIVLPLVWIFSSAAAEKPLSLLVKISEQKMYLLRDDRVVAKYPVSTAKNGAGNRLSSGKTPLGRHAVAKMIGDGAPPLTIFRNRVSTGKRAKVNPTREPLNADLITSRILWLRGLEPGKNRGGHVDSYRRFIYIHGTADEGLIGTPASHGCIRMRNDDVIDLFDRVGVGTLVDILA